MQRRNKIAIAVGTVAALGTIASAAIAQGPSDDDAGETDVPITGDALDAASEAALAHLGEGRVTETEVDDEDSKYEVEVTLDDGSQVDVQLDETFAVVGTEDDGAGETDD